jgi:hypothetical protein
LDHPIYGVPLDWPAGLFSAIVHPTVDKTLKTVDNPILVWIKAVKRALSPGIPPPNTPYIWGVPLNKAYITQRWITLWIMWITL